MENGKIREKKKYFFSKNLKRQTIFMAISVCAVLLIMFGTSYAIFSSVNKSEDYNGINVGDLHITYEDESGAVSLTNSFPVSDEVGLQGTPYSFSIQNTGSLATTYYVDLSPDMGVIEEEEENDPDIDQKLLEDKDIKVSVNGGTPTIIEDLPDGCELAEGTLQPGETKKFTVRLWIRSDAGNDIFYEGANGDLVGKSYYGMITVSGENTKTYETDGLVMWLDGKNRVGDDSLPEGYKRVEYLESTGTQFIVLDTTYNSSNKYTIKTEVQAGTNYSRGTYSGWNAGGLFGVSYDNDNWTDGTYSATINSEIKTKIEQTINAGSSSQTITKLTTTEYNEIEETISRAHQSLSTYAGNTGYPIFTSSKSSGTIPYNSISMKLWNLELYVNDVLTHNLIPCLDNNGVPCMYDTVSKTTFYNQGTGEFNYGSIVSTNDSTKWYDLSGNNNNYDLSNFTNGSWNSNSLNINGNVSSLGLNYDVSSLDTYSMSTAIKLNSSNSGNINIFNTNDINVYLSNNKLMYGDIDSEITLDNDELYTVTLVKKKKYTMKTDGTKESKTVLEVYVNGEFSKDITTAEKTNVSGSNINIDIYNYLVYSKALSVNEDNNNYRLTVERYGD